MVLSILLPDQRYMAGIFSFDLKGHDKSRQKSPATILAVSVVKKTTKLNNT